MGVMEILREYVREWDPQVRSILVEVILAEQAQIDLERPRIKERVREAVDIAVREEERRR